MRFCLIGPVWPYRGGISHNSAIISNAMLQAGHEVLLISFKRQYPQWLYPGKTDRDNSQSPLKAEAEYILDPLSPLTWWKAAKRVAAYKPDLVAIQWWTVFWSIPFAFIARYIQNKKFKLAFLLHNVFPHEPRPWDRFLARLTLSPAKDFLAFSSLEEQKLHELLPGRRVIISPLPTYTFDSDASMTKESARETLHLPQDQKILLFFGFVRPYKGLHILLQALTGLKARNIKPYLAIVGEFWHDKQSYLDYIQQHELEHQLRIEDRYVPNEEAALWFTAADVMVAPYVEGVTQSAVASLAAGFGIPMIVTEQVAQGLGEIQNKRILVVKAGNPESLIGAIENLFQNQIGLDNPVTLPPTSTNFIEQMEVLAKG